MKKIICLIMLIIIYTVGICFARSVKLPDRVINEKTFGWVNVAKSKLIACWSENEINIWDIEKGVISGTIKKEGIDPNHDYSLSVSPQGKWVAIITSTEELNGKVEFINLEDPAITKTKKAIVQNAIDLYGEGFSSDENTFLCSSWRQQLVVAIDVNTGSILWKTNYDYTPRAGTFIALDGSYFVTQDLEEAVIWVGKSGEKIGEIKISEDIEDLCFSGDSKYLLIWDREGKYLKKLSLPDLKTTWEIKNCGNVYDTSSDGKYIILFDKSKTEIIVRDSQKGEEVSRLKTNINDIEIRFIPFSINYIYFPALKLEKEDKGKNVNYYNRENNIISIADSLKGKILKTIEIKKPEK